MSEKNIIEYPLTNILNKQNKVWLTWISNNETLTTGIISIIDNLQGYCSIYNETGQFIGNIELNETANLKNHITFLEIISSTGLQIKTDPGIPIYLQWLFLFND
jgi:cytochrome c biogenesis protein